MLARVIAAEIRDASKPIRLAFAGFLGCGAELLTLNEEAPDLLAAHIELAEIPRDVRDGASVIVTFLTSSSIDLQARGINEAQVYLRTRLDD